ncbi:unnamed protein product [Rhizophagus irregularis]|nr:unnamed protein product [Rhizophagus irregularis]
MKAAIAERNANFYEDKAIYPKLIESRKRSIVLDRVLVTDIPVGPSRSPFKSLNELPERWKNRYTPISNINPEILSIVSADIPDDWRLASIVPIPKPHEFECLLKNTRPITLLETARKLLVKIITNRLSKIMATHQVLTGDNFAGLPGSSITTPINVLDGIMKSHRILPRHKNYGF